MAEIVTKNLTKRYGERKGVFDLSIEIARGEAFGLIGPNGAGKTTLIRNLLGFIRPDSGQCLIRNLDSFREAREAHRALGYMPGEIAFFESIKGSEYLQFCEELRKSKAEKRKKELLERFELNPGVKVRHMSKGMKQKLGLIAAMMFDPEIYILDEPTSGLDPLMQQRFVELVLEEKRKGKTLLISSHSFDEIEKTCDRIGILKEGRLMTDQGVSQLQKSRRRVYSLSFQDEKSASDFLKEGFELVQKSGSRLDIAIAGSVKPLVDKLAHYPVNGLDVLTHSLEDAFMTYYGEERQ